MPIGYGGFTTLFAQVNTGINVFPEFRGSEAAYAFEQALRVMHALTGNARFVVNPYQFGAGNDEALQSGAYWFYYRLGFRSAQAPVRALAEKEFARLRADRRYRVPIATLRKLAACDIHLDLTDDAGEKFFDEPRLEALGAGITAAIAREGAASRAEALASMEKRLAGLLGIRLADLSAVERRGFAQFAPILTQVADLAAWPKADREALRRIVRARWAPRERDFISLMCAHDRLRIALARAAAAARGSAVAAARQRRPFASASSLASATSRVIGARPQLVQAYSRCFGTNCSARPMVSATSSGVSISVDATSITPTSTSLPSSSRISSGGTCEWMHSSDTCLIELRASAGKTCSYCRHSSPRLFFQSMLAWMP